MAVDVGAPIEQIGRALQEAGEEPTAEGDTEAQASAMGTYMLKPTAISLLERGGQPFRITDVYAQAKDDALSVTAWVRAKGLRLVPVRFAWQQVDNPDAAHAFAEEVRARSQNVPHPGHFRGPMEYWISWLLLGVLIFALLMPRGDQEHKHSEQV